MASDDSGPAAPKKRGRLRKKPLELDALDTALEQPRKRQKASRASSEVAGAGRRRAGPVTYAEDAATDGTASGDGSTSQSEDEELEPGDLNDECCTACGSSEDYDSLLCCEICPCVYHLHCLDPPLLAVPKGDWFCPRCTRLLELENLERILAMRTRSAEAIAAEAAAATGKGAAKSATSSKAAATKDSNSNSVAAAIRASIATIRSVVNSPTHGQTAPPDAPETSAREGADGSTPASPAAAKPAGAMGPAAIGTPSKSASAADALPPALLPGDKPGQVVREFHVKWKGRSYMHCSWVRESDLELLGRRLPGVRAKWVNFLRKDNQAGQANDHADESDVGDWVWGVHRNWLLVDRVVASREKRGSGMQYLVKWKDLGYDECTWEDEADLRAFRAEIDRFKSRQEPIATQLADRRASHAQAGPSTTSGPPPRRSARGKKEGERRFSGTPDFLTGGSLHPYQLEGLNWLFFAWEQRKHVILADEMGLGKTIQAIAFMAALKQEHVPRPHLVVVPLSTLPNWEREFATWAPQLNVVTFAGNQAARDTIKQYEFLVSAQAPPGKGKGSRAADHQARIKFHVLLTSYEMALAEISELRRLHWETLIVDEGHRLKNSSSRLFTALHDLRAVQRTLLTGTPLQNNLGELFMLLHFLDASKFGSQEEFQQEFADISHGEQVTRLHQLLSPHLLRRTKKDVLKQLPPKREQIVRVELSALQKEYYRGILTKNFPNLAAGRAQTSRLKNVMMELRKCCNHPYLFEGAEPHIADPQKALAELVEASGKLALLDKMMAKMKECGHRVLIYSQFTRLLDILEDWLVGRRWGYQRIDGTIASADRQARIDAFNTHPADNFCFLLSTRAGGLGINLATADTVIIYDSDWNPHNDLQAQARAHRLGQQRGVMIYRLVTRATIEERMMQQTKKKMVLEHLVVQKMGAASDLRQDELDDLLRYGAAELFADAASRQLLVATHPSAGDADKASLEGGAAATAVATQGAGGDAGKPNAVIRTAEREQQEGRTGGDARRIVYDDAAIERLLDRSDLLHQPPDQEEEKEGDLMKAFKVANFEFMEDEADQNGTGKDGEAEDAGVPPPDTSKTSASFWGELLKDKFAELEEAETSALGKGKRERKQVNYQDPSLPVAAGAADEATSDKEDTSFSASHTASASSEEGSGSDSEASAGGRRGRKRLRRDSSLAAAGGAAPALPPLLRSHGSQLHILGFTSAHRDLFIKTLMRFGLGPARPDGGFTWDRYKPLFPRMPAGQVEAYGRLLLQHLNTPEPQDGVPKAALLQGNKSEDVLIRLATLHLILHKLQETEGKDPATFTAGPAGWRRLAATRVWAPEQDRKLLQGVRRRGYGRWRDILTDPELGLEPVVRAELRLPSLESEAAGASWSAAEGVSNPAAAGLAKLEPHASGSALPGSAGVAAEAGVPATAPASPEVIDLSEDPPAVAPNGLALVAGTASAHLASSIPSSAQHSTMPAADQQPNGQAPGSQQQGRGAISPAAAAGAAAMQRLAAASAVSADAAGAAQPATLPQANGATTAAGAAQPATLPQATGLATASTAAVGAGTAPGSRPRTTARIPAALDTRRAEMQRKMHLWIKQRLLAVVEALRAEYCSNGTPADGVATIESAKAGQSRDPRTLAQAASGNAAPQQGAHRPQQPTIRAPVAPPQPAGAQPVPISAGPATSYMPGWRAQAAVVQPQPAVQHAQAGRPYVQSGQWAAGRGRGGPVPGTPVTSTTGGQVPGRVLPAAQARQHVGRLPGAATVQSGFQARHGTTGVASSIAPHTATAAPWLMQPGGQMHIRPYVLYQQQAGALSVPASQPQSSLGAAARPLYPGYLPNGSVPGMVVGIPQAMAPPHLQHQQQQQPTGQPTASSSAAASSPADSAKRLRPILPRPTGMHPTAQPVHLASAQARVSLPAVQPRPAALQPAAQHAQRTISVPISAAGQSAPPGRTRTAAVALSQRGSSTASNPAGRLQPAPAPAASTAMPTTQHVVAPQAIQPASNTPAHTAAPPSKGSLGATAAAQQPVQPAGSAAGTKPQAQFSGGLGALEAVLAAAAARAGENAGQHSVRASNTAQAGGQPAMAAAAAGPAARPNGAAGQSDAVNAAKLVADYQRMLVLTRKVREEALAIASNPQATVGMVINAGNMFRADLLKLEELARAMMHSASFLYKPPPMPDAVQAAQPTAGPSAPGRVPSGKAAAQAAPTSHLPTTAAAPAAFNHPVPSAPAAAVPSPAAQQASPSAAQPSAIPGMPTSPWAGPSSPQTPAGATFTAKQWLASGRGADQSQQQATQAHQLRAVSQQHGAQQQQPVAGAAADKAAPAVQPQQAAPTAAAHEVVVIDSSVSADLSEGPSAEGSRDHARVAGGAAAGPIQELSVSRDLSDPHGGSADAPGQGRREQREVTSPEKPCQPAAAAHPAAGNALAVVAGIPGGNPTQPAPPKASALASLVGMFAPGAAGRGRGMQTPNGPAPVSAGRGRDPRLAAAANPAGAGRGRDPRTTTADGSAATGQGQDLQRTAPSQSTAAQGTNEHPVADALVPSSSMKVAQQGTPPESGGSGLPVKTGAGSGTRAQAAAGGQPGSQAGTGPGQGGNGSGSAAVPAEGGTNEPSDAEQVLDALGADAVIVRESDDESEVVDIGG